MASQTQTHSHSGRVRVHHTVVVNSVVIAEPYGSIVRLVHAKEDVDWICGQRVTERDREREGRGEEGREEENESYIRVPNCMSNKNRTVDRSSKFYLQMTSRTIQW